MKLTIEKNVLLKALQDISKAIPAKPVIPILGNFLLEVKGDLLCLTAADGELIAMRCIVKPDACREPGRVTVPAKVLLDLIKVLPEGPVDIEETDHSSLQINAGFSESEIPVMDAAEYIDIMIPANTATKFNISSERLAEAIGKTLYAVATEDIRPALCGLYFDLKPGTSAVAASDSRKLVVYDIETPEISSENGFILPSKAASIIKGVLPKDGVITVTFDDNNARFCFGNTDITTRLTTGKYPRYRSVIPTGNDKIVVMSRKSLLESLQRMSVVADKKSFIVKLSLNYNEMTLSSENLGTSTRGCDKLECDYDGEPMSIGLKVPVVIDTLSNIDAQNVEIRLKDPTKAVLVVPVKEEEKDEPVTALVMPIRLNA